MGQLGSAYCKCGYGLRITLGGGRSNHLTFAGYPHLCKSCNSVFTGNLFEDASSCEHCESSDTSSYEDAALWEPRDTSDRTQVFDWSMYIGPAPPPEPPPEPQKGLLRKLWRALSESKVEPMPRSTRREVVLHRGGYLCPKCNDFSMSFESFGHFS